MARRVAAHAGGRRLVARARRREGQRQPDFLHLVDRRQLQDRRQPDHRGRDPLRADLLHVDGVPHRLCPAQGLLREGRRGRLREEADRNSAPIWSTNIRATPSSGSRPIPHYWGEKPAFETVIFKFVPDATTRVAEIESGSSDVTLEVPYEEFDRLKKVKGLSGVATPDLRHRHDLHHQQGADARQERAARRDHGDRQEGDRRAAAARLRRADRHAGSARIFGLRSRRSRRLTIRRRRPNCSPPRATRPRSRSSSRSRRPAASSRKTTR